MGYTALTDTRHTTFEIWHQLNYSPQNRSRGARHDFLNIKMIIFWLILRGYQYAQES